MQLAPRRERQAGPPRARGAGNRPARQHRPDAGDLRLEAKEEAELGGGIATQRGQDRRILTLLRAVLLACLIAAAWVAMLGTPAAQGASTFTVNDLGDAPDMTVGDGDCDTNAGPDEFPCTLRAAIQEANAVAGVDAIAFDQSIAGT